VIAGQLCVPHKCAAQAQYQKGQHNRADDEEAHKLKVAWNLIMMLLIGGFALSCVHQFAQSRQVRASRRGRAGALPLPSHRSRAQAEIDEAALAKPTDAASEDGSEGGDEASGYESEEADEEPQSPADPDE
jgi:hypothetical protein